MKLSEIFSAEDMSAKEKIQAIANIVETARSRYGNAEAKITAPEINTINGLEDIAMLCDESKVAIAESEVTNIRLISVEYVKAFEGAILDRKIEELIAISPILANITATTESAYI